MEIFSDSTSNSLLLRLFQCRARPLSTCLDTMALPEKKDKVKGVSDRKAAPDGKWRKDYQKIRESLGKVTDLVGITHHGHVTKRLPSLIFNIMIKNELLYVGVLVISFSSTQ